MQPTDLESVVDRELKRLPQPPAPLTLLPRVLAAAEQWASRPWYTRPWATWPRQWQAGSIGALVLLTIGAAWAITWVQAVAGAELTTVAARPTRTMRDISSVLQGAETTANAVRVVWLALVQPVVVYAGAFVVVMFSACVCLGTAINRVVFGKAFQS
jgi:hypothetical protein